MRPIVLLGYRPWNHLLHLHGVDALLLRVRTASALQAQQARAGHSCAILVTMKPIPLSQGLFAIVDDEDFEWLTDQGLWSARRQPSGLCYAVRRESGHYFYMHQVVMELREDYGIPPNQVVNHKDGDGLNNQTQNLEIITLPENTRHYHRNRAKLRRKPK